VLLPQTRRLQTVLGSGRRATVHASGAAALQLVEESSFSPEHMFEMGHTELAAFSDDEIASAYYALRDEVEPRGEGAATTEHKAPCGHGFEREKDRRRFGPGGSRKRPSGRRGTKGR